jgi:hypothetical protein
MGCRVNLGLTSPVTVGLKKAFGQIGRRLRPRNGVRMAEREANQDNRLPRSRHGQAFRHLVVPFLMRSHCVEIKLRNRPSSIVSDA